MIDINLCYRNRFLTRSSLNRPSCIIISQFSQVGLFVAHGVQEMGISVSSVKAVRIGKQRPLALRFSRISLLAFDAHSFPEFLEPYWLGKWADLTVVVLSSSLEIAAEST